MNADLFLSKLQESLPLKGSKRSDTQRLLKLFIANWSILSPVIQSLEPSKSDPIMAGEVLRREIIRLNFNDSTKLWCLIGSGKHTFWPVLGQFIKETSNV